MDRITLERYLNEPGLELGLQAQARQARAAWVARQLRSLAERLKPRPMHWLARLG